MEPEFQILDVGTVRIRILNPDYWITDSDLYPALFLQWFS
jgi:hypothetical protein